MQHEVIQHMIQKIRISILLCLSIAMISLVSDTYFGVANSQQNKILMQSQGTPSVTTANATNMNIVLASKVCPIYQSVSTKPR
jgi:hypothetical protein